LRIVVPIAVLFPALMITNMADGGLPIMIVLGAFTVLFGVSGSTNHDEDNGDDFYFSDLSGTNSSLGSVPPTIVSLRWARCTALHLAEAAAMGTLVR
jgi:hypothetical protein